MSTLSEIRHKCEQVIEATMRCKDVVPRETYEMYLRRMHKRPDVVPPKEVVDLLNRIKRVPFQSKNRRKMRSRHKKIKQIQARAKEIGII